MTPAQEARKAKYAQQKDAEALRLYEREKAAQAPDPVHPSREGCAWEVLPPARAAGHGLLRPARDPLRLPANDRARPVIQCARLDCGELFVPRDDAHKHCSRRCYAIMWARAHAVRKHKRARICKVCGDLFMSIRESHETCSPACYRTLRKWRAAGL